MIRELTATQFAALAGLAESELPASCRAAIAKGDLRYELPQASERDAIILGVLQHIDSDKPTKVGEQRAGIWESCWSDNLQRFVEAGCDPEQLVPDFIKPDQPVRLDGDYAIPRNPRFEVNFLSACRAYLYERFLAGAKSVYEFGCGSGFNLLAFERLLPGRKLYGLDWSKSSNETVNLLREKLRIDIRGRAFDFFNPDPGLALDAQSGVLTVCALEQVGPRHGEFVTWLLGKKPQVCVNMEPLLDLYDETRLPDWLAARFHRKRGYLEGFLPALKALQAQGRIEILDVRRFRFGSLYHEGYSYVAWRPL